MTPDNIRDLIAEARTDISDAERCEMLGVTPSVGTLLRMLRKTTDALAALTTGQGVDAPSVREAIGEVLADMGAVIEGMPVASDLAALTEITDAAIRAAVSPPSRTAKRTGYETVGHAVGEHSQTIRATAALTTPQDGGVIEAPHWPDGCALTVKELAAPEYGHLDCTRPAPEPEWEAADNFIKNGALWYSPRPNGDPKTLVRRRKAGPWLPAGGDDE